MQDEDVLRRRNDKCDALNWISDRPSKWFCTHSELFALSWKWLQQAHEQVLFRQRPKIDDHAFCFFLHCSQHRHERIKVPHFRSECQSMNLPRVAICTNVTQKDSRHLRLLRCNICHEGRLTRVLHKITHKFHQWQDTRHHCSTAWNHISWWFRDIEKM